MTLNYDHIMNLELEDKPHTYETRDAMLYALGIGFGTDPLNEKELDFVYEKSLKTVPTMATVIAWDSRWYENSGIDRTHVVHGEQRIRLHRPLPSSATVLSRPKVTGVFDKGKGKGAIVIIENTIREKETGEPLCTNTSTIFARANGGFGGPTEGAPAPHRLPEREPDLTVTSPTRPDQALLYRLSGDYNPLHAEPAFAQAAGFSKPILHGLCTYGIACRAIVSEVCDYDATRITGFDVRFSSPVIPGETILTDIWKDGGTISFRCRLAERDAVVINNGKATINEA